MCADESWFILVWLLIGWEGGASFFKPITKWGNRALFNWLSQNQSNHASQSQRAKTIQPVNQSKTRSEYIKYSLFLRWAGEWVESVDAEHAGAGLGDAIINNQSYQSYHNQLFVHLGTQQLAFKMFLVTVMMFVPCEQSLFDLPRSVGKGKRKEGQRGSARRVWCLSQ